eukprot:c17790_g1_i1.p1 GENE.c17790_g1_i1~~c17790_g1_i1.p1  ORF type:complete len:374 (-),score=91.18 c17790_g1_i1:277-1398(-)
MGIAKSKQQQQSNATTLKLLILGAAGAGKTTLFKQMKNIHHNSARPFETSPQSNPCKKEDQAYFAQLIRSQCVQDFCSLVKEAKRLLLLTPEITKTVETLLGPFHSSQDNPQVAAQLLQNENTRTTLLAIWHSAPIQKAFVSLKRFRAIEYTQHFLDNLEEIGCASYHPTELDILLNYTPSKGSVQTSVSISPTLNCRLIDVGGRKSERRNWLTHFDNVDAVVFVAALNEFDHFVVAGDNETVHTNKLADSISLFEDIAQCPLLANSAMILVLGKRDVFDHKLKRTKEAKDSNTTAANAMDFNSCFPEYSGDSTDSKKVARFISKQFQSKCNTSTQSFFVHSVNGLCREEVRGVMDVLDELTMCQNILSTGML